MPLANPFAKHIPFFSNWTFWSKFSGKNAKGYFDTAADSVAANLNLSLSIPYNRFRSSTKKLVNVFFLKQHDRLSNKS